MIELLCPLLIVFVQIMAVKTIAFFFGFGIAGGVSYGGLNIGGGFGGLIGTIVGVFAGYAAYIELLAAFDTLFSICPKG